MTAWQDQPPLSNKPLSRRQVRQNERGDAIGVVASPAEQADFAGFPREGWDTEARRIAAAAPQPRTEAPPVGTRRSQRSLQAVEPQSAEPLDYATQGRPQAPSTDGQPLRRRPVSAVDNQLQQPQSFDPLQQQPGYRVRDFSPEGRRSFSSTTPVDQTPPENLQYRTQGSPVPGTPIGPAAPVQERTLSRRELRARETEQHAPVWGDPFASTPPALVEPPAPVEQPRLRERTRQPDPGMDYPPPSPAQAVLPAPVPDVRPREEPSTYTPPTGNWSTQAMIDDDEQFQENTLSRNVAATSGAITTSVLVLPSLPSEDVLRPLGSTGEILLTGSIDLPRSLSSTGSHPSRYDHSDVDTLLEASDREDAAPDSAPVRAISAVSTHTSTRGVMEAKKPKGNSRLPIVLAVTATAMAVGVVVLVVAGLVFGIL